MRQQQGGQQAGLIGFQKSREAGGRQVTQKQRKISSSPFSDECPCFLPDRLVISTIKTSGVRFVGSAEMQQEELGCFILLLNRYTANTAKQMLQILRSKYCKYCEANTTNTVKQILRRKYFLLLTELTITIRSKANTLPANCYFPHLRFGATQFRIKGSVLHFALRFGSTQFRIKGRQNGT